MAIGVNWTNIWDESIWDTTIWAQANIDPPAAVASTGNQRRHTIGLVEFMRR